MNKKLNRTELETLFGIIGFLISLFLGILLHSQISKRRTLNADDILEKVKEQFRTEGPLDGSWIELTKVPWKKFAYETDVYYGGISRFEESDLVQYEFIADAYSGSLIDLYRV